MPGPETTSNRVVGQPVPMREGRERVTGRLKFVINHEAPGMLHAKVFRSTVAHGRITRLDTSAAERSSGVVGVLTGRDLANPAINPWYGPVFPDRPVVANQKVRYVGEPVAVVIAEDGDAAIEALERIEAEYEELPAYFDPESAIHPDAEPLHDLVQRREFLTFPDLVLNTEAGRNIFNHFKLRKGDVERALAQADCVFEGTYRTPAQQHVSLEPHVAICQIRDGQITLWSSASSPYTARFQVAETLKVRQSQVRIVTWNIGGAYGGKTYPRIEPLVALASWKVDGRPVRLEFSRAEEFYTISRHAAVVKCTTAVMRDGTMVARKARILWSAGAYADISPRVCKNGGYSAVGPYRIPNAWIDSYAVYTNVTPAGGFRGYAVPQVTWAYESQMDEIAHALGIDPLELRRRNLVREGDLFSTGQAMDDIHYEALLARTAGAIGWGTRPPLRAAPVARDAEGGVRRGKGLAITVKTTVTPSASTASVKLNEDGSVSLLVSTTEVGQGSRTVLAQIAADAVGVPMEHVYQAYPDTALTPWDQTTSSSRSTIMMGEAIRRAGAEVRRQVREIAADLLEVSVEDLEIGDGAVWVRGVPGQLLTLGQVVQRARRGNLLGSGTYASEGHLDAETGQGVASVRFFQAACGVQAAVDLETGRVRLESLYLDTYGGKIVNPPLAELQSEGNVAFGIGQALLEEMVIDNGQVANANLGDYMIPSFEDLPDQLDVGLLEHPSGNGPMHGLGECGSAVVPAAVSNAVFDACGVRLTELPITPEKVLRALRELQ
ncbi:MAG: xanthine dehydrogenase family protein molybdopterin-binding subunit [Chloroflexi bacterium]|nr:xanthine dehydrogenase family protein molybdopterin-binding subunit [Chloroflexota bacterium]